MRARRNAVAAYLIAAALAPAPSASEATLIGIVVTSAADTSNGDTSSAASLEADPGPDGVSLREALQVTLNDPGVYAIRFDPGLTGATIALSTDLPLLTAGGVTVDGDIDGDGEPDVTIDGTAAGAIPAFTIGSSDNHLRSLSLTGFLNGVVFSPKEGAGEIPTGETFRGNSVTGLVMTEIERIGVDVESVLCGIAPDHPPPCETFNTWADTVITDNTIEAGEAGIVFFISGTGDRVEGAEIRRNAITGTGDDTDAGIRVGDGGNADGIVISDVVIAGNTVEREGIGIQVIAGAGRSQGATTRDVRVLNNTVSAREGAAGFCCQGIVIQAGSDIAPFAEGDPPRYLDDSTLTGVKVKGNTVTGHLEWGIQVLSGSINGGRRNLAEDVRIVDNVVRSTRPAIGIQVSSAWNSVDTVGGRHARRNRIRDVWIKGNEVSVPAGSGAKLAAGGIRASGVAIVGGHHRADGNTVRRVRIRENDIRTPYVGIRVIGGHSDPATENRVVCVRRSGNRFEGTRRNLLAKANAAGAEGNRVRLGC